jgi:CPA2 family monovalent cation:H+ antiporter-2
MLDCDWSSDVCSSDLKRHGVTVLALRRGGEVLSNPEASIRLAAGDVAVVMGPAERLAAARELFRPEGEA